MTICILLGQGIAVSAAKTPVAAHGRLSVKGVDLIDAKGKKFQLRGISSHGINWDVGAPYVNKASFKTLRDDWGANAVIIVGTPNWSQLGSEVANHPIKGYKNIMYSLHFYANEKNTVNICLRSWMRAERKDWQ